MSSTKKNIHVEKTMGVKQYKMPFNLIQFIKWSSWDVVWSCSEFEETLCELSSSLCASIRSCTAVNSYATPKTQVVIKSIQWNHSDTHLHVMLCSQSGNGPVPNSGCQSSTTFTSPLKNLTNTHFVLDLSMLSRFSRSFSCWFNHLSATAKVFIQGDRLFCL